MLFRATPVIATFVFLVATLSTNTSSVQCFAFHHDSPRSNVFKQPSSNRLLVQLETKAVKADVLSPIRKNAFYLISTCITFAVLLLPPSIAWADGQTKDFKFPPIDYGDKSRCVLKGGSSMGQANAARDKLYDLRQCQLSGINAAGYDLSGVSKYLCSKVLFLPLYYGCLSHNTYSYDIYRSFQSNFKRSTI
jgi:hypothetical protein